MRTGYVLLPLHGGKAPRRLVNRVVRRAGEVACHLVSEHGSDEVLGPLSDPFRSQAFGCAARVDRTDEVAALGRLAQLRGAA